LYNNDYQTFDDGRDAQILSVGVAAIVVGAALGAAAALLFAPKSGRDLREFLLARAGNWRSLAEDTLTSGREKLVSFVEEQAKK
jgi:gas vesicle protein